MYQTLNNNMNTECCICLEEFDVEALDEKTINISDINKTHKRCKCSALVHRECIVKWYRNKKKLRCIVCNSYVAAPAPTLTPRHAATSRNTDDFHRKCKCFTAVFLAIFVLFLVYTSLAHAPNIISSDSSDDDPALVMLGSYI